MRETDYWRKPVARRRALYGAALGGVGLAGAVALGCGGREAPSEVVISTQQPKTGGTLVHRHSGNGIFGLGFDPHVISGNETGMMGIFYQSLLRLKPGVFTPEPEIAQSWEQPSDTDYVFRLSPGVRFHNKPPANGRELTAADVAFNLNRARTNEPRFINRSVLAGIDRIEALDQTTVRITSKAPDVTILTNLADATLQILAPAVFERFDKLTSPDQVIGTGAFILTGLDDVSATTTRNPSYWRPGLPYLDGVNVVAIQDDQAAFAAFLSGQLNVSFVPGTEAKKFFDEQATAKKYLVDTVKGVLNIYLMQNTTNKPFDDPRVTKALRLLIDHEEAIRAYLEVWFGTGSTYMLTHAMEDWDLPAAEYSGLLEWKRPKDDAAKEAMALLSAAGFTRAEPLKFELLTSTLTKAEVTSAEVIQATWRRLAPGVVDATIKTADDATARSFEARSAFEVRTPIGRASFFDPDQLFRSIFYTGGSLNFAKYSDATLDRLIDRQRSIFNIAQRKSAIQEIVRHLVDNGPYSPYASRDWANAAQLKVRNWSPETLRIPGFQYESVWFDV